MTSIGSSEPDPIQGEKSKEDVPGSGVDTGGMEAGKRERLSDEDRGLTIPEGGEDGADNVCVASGLPARD